MPIGLTAKITPKNDGFLGMVDANQVIGTSGGAYDSYLPSSAISGNSIQEYYLKISNTPTDGYYLQYKDGTDRLTWAAVVGGSDVAWSGAYQFYVVSSLNKTQYNQYTGFSSNRGLYYPSSLGKNLYNFSSNARILFAGSSQVSGRFYPSSLGKALYNFSANKSLYTNSSNVRFRFPASSTAISRYADSSNIRFRFKNSSNIWVFASSQKLSGQLLSLHSARDINSWNSHSWKNSGLIWNETLNKWNAKPSGGADGVTDHGALTGLTDDDHSQYYESTRLTNYTKIISGNSLSGQKAQFWIRNTFSSSKFYAQSSNVRFRFPASGAGTRWAELIGGGLTTLHTHAGGVAIADGGTNYVQFNTGGFMDSDPEFTYNPETNTLRISGAISSNNISGGIINTRNIYVNNRILRTTSTYIGFGETLVLFNVGGAQQLSIDSTTTPNVKFTSDISLENSYNLYKARKIFSKYISGASISGTKISGGSIYGNWFGKQITSPYITGYINSSTAIGRFYPSTLGNATSGSLHKLWLWSSNKSWYAQSSNVRSRFADSSNIRFRFKGSSNQWLYVSSQKISSGTILGNTITIGNVSNTEFGYLDGVTSAIQTQLNLKATIANYIASTTAIAKFGDSSNIRFRFPGSSAAAGRYYPSSVGQKTSGSVHKLWLWSSNKSWYANSSNVRTRFKGSSNRWVFVSSQRISGGTIKLAIISGITRNITYTNLAELVGQGITSLHSHAGGNLSGPMAGTIGANFNYGISGLKFISSQRISSNIVRCRDIFFSGNEFNSYLEHSSLTGSQLHNPKGIHYAEDMFFWNSHFWHNSGLIWNETASGGRWKPKPSGSTGGGGSPIGAAGDIQYYVNATTFGGESSFNYNSATNTINLDGAISGNNAEFHIYKGGWSGSQIKGAYITSYIASSTATGRFADSSNIRIRFPASSTAKSIFAGSSNYATHKTTYSNYTVSGHLRSIDYRNISSNAKIGQHLSSSGNKYTWAYKSILDSGVKWYAAYKHSANTGIHSFNIANYITSTTAINRFYPSTTGKATSGSVAKLWLWSSNKSWYANSSNVRFRFYPSSLGKSLMNFSSNKSLYANSANVRFRFPASGAGTRWYTLTQNGDASALHTHAGTPSAPGGSFTANIGSNYTYGISGVKFVSSQRISGGSIRCKEMTFSGSNVVSIMHHYDLTGAQLHNPKGIHYAEDLLFWNSHKWKNSGLIWNETISGGRWCPKRSGSSSGGTPGGSDTQIQFNNSSAFGGDSNLTWDLANKYFTTAGTIWSESCSSNKFCGLSFRLGVDQLNVTSILDEDSMGSNSATALVTQQSVKAYTNTISSNIRYRFPGSSNIKSVYKPSSGRWGYVSSQYISGSWMTPIYRGGGKPVAGIGYEGRIIRTSGTSTNKSYAWICMRNSAGNYEWDLLSVST
jgi:hypothetical protein